MQSNILPKNFYTILLIPKFGGHDENRASFVGRIQDNSMC